MVVIAVFSGAFCPGDEVSAGVAEKLGLRLAGDDALVAAAAERGGLSREKLARALRGSTTFLNRLTRERERCVARLRVELVELIAADGLVFHGFGAHLLARPPRHVLRVGLAGPREYRLRQAEAHGLSPREAAARLAEEDARREAWTRFLFDRSTWDKGLYDVFLPMQSMSAAEAATTISEYADQPALGLDSAARKAVRDVRLAARVELSLTERGHDVDVDCDDGVTTILIREPVLRFRRLEHSLARAARAVEGVTAVTVRPGPRYRQPSIYAALDLEVPSRILLVDDEKDFVHSLSERLRGRSIAAAVAYDGEEALAKVAVDEPEVMVLDLKMPGIDGLEVLRRVKREHPRVEVIILTGHGSEAEERLAYELGAFAYLRKPVEIDVLTRTMQEAYKKTGNAGARTPWRG
ncbi:MAG: response regulator [Planctomycetota bacterium]